MIPAATNRKTMYAMAGVLAIALTVSCAVMPAPVNRAALPPMPFPRLVEQAGAYHGRMVILGGYVLAVEQRADHTRLEALQAPLGFGQEPRSRDLSQGRLIVHHAGFLDPEVYEKGRKITVAGLLLGSSAWEAGGHAYPYVRIRSDSLYLWPPERSVPPPGYYHPWGYPPRHRWYWGLGGY